MKYYDTHKTADEESKRVDTHKAKHGQKEKLIVVSTYPSFVVLKFSIAKEQVHEKQPAGRPRRADDVRCRKEDALAMR